MDCSLVFVVVEQVVGVEDLHEGAVYVVLHLPNPGPVEGDAPLLSDAREVSSHQQRQEPTLRNVFLELRLAALRFGSNILIDVLSDEGSFSHCVDSGLGRERVSALRIFKRNAVAAGKHIFVRSRLEELVHLVVASQCV